MKWKLVSVRFEMVFISTQDRCTVCAERTIGSEISLDAPDGLLGDVVKWRLISACLEIVLNSTQDSCTVCAKRTKGSEISLDAPDGTSR